MKISFFMHFVFILCILKITESILLERNLDENLRGKNGIIAEYCELCLKTNQTIIIESNKTGNSLILSNCFSKCNTYKNYKPLQDFTVEVNNINTIIFSVTVGVALILTVVFIIICCCCIGCPCYNCCKNDAPVNPLYTPSTYGTILSTGTIHPTSKQILSIDKKQTSQQVFFPSNQNQYQVPSISQPLQLKKGSEIRNLDQPQISERPIVSFENKGNKAYQDTSIANAK